jgi:cytochrome d ubiquinol oxidase subunit I
MDPVTLARWQFGMTAAYHWIFVPLTMGLSVLVALMQTLFVATGHEVYRRMTKFWGKLFVVNFALGVVTGIVMEFQFGMNWSNYSRFVGDVFGAPLAIEALLAFFIESTFLGLWIFGWDRLPQRIHLASIWLVALASNISALWILIANSFMQNPVGYAIRGERAEMTDFFALILNHNVWVQFPHVVTGALATAAFFVLGVSAYHLLRGSHTDLFRRSFRIAAMVAIVTVPLIILTGHAQAQFKEQTQPMKLAAIEALFETENPASFSLFTIGDLEGRREVFAIRVPYLLSLLAHNQITGEVRGINDLQAEYERRHGPGDYVPPAWVVYWSFRAMVGAGFLMLFLAAYAAFLSIGDLEDRRPRLLRLLPYAIGLPYIAGITGWLVAEVGRWPWAVQGLLLIQDAVSPNVPAAAVLATLIGFTVLYGVLLAVGTALVVKFVRAGPEEPETSGSSPVPSPAVAG